MNSRNKGARGEREFAQFLRERGVQARRGQQFAGSPDSPDVVIDAAWNCHLEVKRTERLSLYPAMEQAKNDCGDAMPVVVHKKNRQEWLAVLRADDLVNLLKTIDVLQAQLQKCQHGQNHQKNSKDDSKDYF